MGGSVALSGRERRPYAVTNTQANRNLIAEALRAKVGRFVYVAAHKQPGYEGTAYMQSPEAVVEELRDTKLRHTVIRPTGVFTALTPFVDFARMGCVPLIGEGSARTNPIAASDVARAVVENLVDGPISVSIGGPEILTRRGIAEAAAKAIGKEPFFLSMPVGLARFNAKAARIFNPRVGELMAFAAAVSVVDCVASVYGSQRLEEYFARIAKRL